jgi:hypothetical protein
MWGTGVDNPAAEIQFRAKEKNELPKDVTELAGDEKTRLTTLNGRLAANEKDKTGKSDEDLLDLKKHPDSQIAKFYDDLKNKIIQQTEYEVQFGGKELKFYFKDPEHNTPNEAQIKALYRLNIALALNVFKGGKDDINLLMNDETLKGDYQSVMNVVDLKEVNPDDKSKESYLDFVGNDQVYYKIVNELGLKDKDNDIIMSLLWSGEILDLETYKDKEKGSHKKSDVIKDIEIKFEYKKFMDYLTAKNNEIKSLGGDVLYEKIYPKLKEEFSDMTETIPDINKPYFMYQEGDTIFINKKAVNIGGTWETKKGIEGQTKPATLKQADFMDINGMDWAIATDKNGQLLYVFYNKGKIEEHRVILTLSLQDAIDKMWDLAEKRDSYYEQTKNIVKDVADITAEVYTTIMPVPTIIKAFQDLKKATDDIVGGGGGDSGGGDSGGGPSGGWLW